MRKPKPLSHSTRKILILLVPALIVAQIAAFFFLHFSNRRIALETVDAALEAGSQTFAYTTATRREYRQLTSQLVAKDYGLLGTIATGNRVTTESALVSQLARTGAEMILLTDLEHQVLARAASTPLLNERDDELDRKLAQVAAQVRESSGNLMPLPTGESPTPLYAWVKIVVRAPMPVANMYLAFRVSDAAIAQFTRMTQMRMAFVSREGDGGARIVHTSTLPAGILASDIGQDEISKDSSTVTTSTGEQYRVKLLPMGGIAGHTVEALVAKPFAPVFSPFLKLEGLFAASIIVSSVISILAANLITSRVVNPLEDVAQKDALTGLANRRLFESNLKNAEQNQKALGTGFAVMLMDLNKFKHVNDTYGHESGDLVLKAVAQRVRKLMRAPDTLARLGGDEFAVLLHTNDPQRVTALAQAIVEVVGQPIQLTSGEMVQVGTSIGIAFAPRHSTLGAEVMHGADLAMYVAKKQGSGFAFAEPPPAAA